MKRFVFTTLAFAAIAIAGDTWAQSDRAYSVRVLASDGCVMLMEPLGMSSVFRKHEGLCKDGLAHGVWIFGHEIITASTGDRRDAVVMSGMFSGMSRGVRINFGKTSGLMMVIDPNFNGFRYFRNFRENEALRPLKELQADIDVVNKIAKDLGLPTLNAASAKSQIAKWYANPDSFIASGNDTGTSGNSAGAQQPFVQQDDPKVFGRSARGG